jgi:hypothetical protein
MYTKLFLLAATASAIGLAGSANAASVVLNNGQPYTYVVHANHAGSGTALLLKTKNIASNVTYSSTDMIDVGNGDGVAQANGVGRNGFTDITVDPFLNFSIMQFKIEGPTGNDPGVDLDIFIEFVGGGTQTISDVFLPANDKMDVVAATGQVMTRITFMGLRNAAGAAQDFRALKQVSFEPAAVVPEPASWAMMIAGFGLLGTAARRRARVAAATG